MDAIASIDADIRVEKSSASDTETQKPLIDVGALMLAHRTQLLRFIQKHIKNREDAEDLLQSSMLEAFRSAARFRGESQPKTWLFGIAVNMIRNHINRSPNCRFNFEDISEMESEVSDCRDPESIVTGRDSSAKLAQYFSTLSDETQQLFDFICLDEMSYEEVAGRLNIPVGTVKSRLSRARALMRQTLDI